MPSAVLSDWRETRPPPVPGQLHVAGPLSGVVAAGDVLTGRTFAAVAISWRVAAPHRRRLVAAVGRRVAALRASGVDVTVISRDGSFRLSCRRDAGWRGKMPGLR